MQDLTTGKYLLSCPPIISEEMFEKAKAKRRNAVQSKRKATSMAHKGHTALIVHKETNHHLAYIGIAKNEQPFFRFSYPALWARTYKKCSITNGDRER